MEIHLQHAQSLCELVLDGSHKPFHTLACPLNQAGLRAEKATQQGRQQGQTAKDLPILLCEISPLVEGQASAAVHVSNGDTLRGRPLVSELLKSGM